MEIEYEFTKKDIERMAKDANDIAEGNLRWKTYKSDCIKRIDNPRKTYMHYFADREVAITCEVLLQTGHCTRDGECDRCGLKTALERAHSEISRGVRRIDRHCKQSVTVNKKGDVIITYYM